MPVATEPTWLAACNEDALETSCFVLLPLPPSPFQESSPFFSPHTRTPVDCAPKQSNRPARTHPKA